MSTTDAQKPSWLTVNLDPIPEALRERNHWVAWMGKHDPQKDRWTKVPYRFTGHGKASTTNQATWASFRLAWMAVRNYDGIGFCLGDGIFGVDLDHCRDRESGVIEPWAQQIVDQLPTYWEVTPSGTGLRAFAFGKLPGSGIKKGPVEIYDQGRYLTVTGHPLPGTHRNVVDCHESIQAIYQQFAETGGEKLESPEDLHRKDWALGAKSRPTEASILAKIERSKTADQFHQLWGGNWQGSYPSQSEADLALMNLLVFWTGPDEGLADAMFRRSGLIRPKWDERHFGNGATYGQETIARALADRTNDDFFDWGKKRDRKKTVRLFAPANSSADPSAPEDIGDSEIIPGIDCDDGRTDVANGKRFARRFGRRVRWCSTMRCWLVWDGRRWCPDHQGRAESAAKRIYADHWSYISQAVDADEATIAAMATFAKATGKAQGIDNMLRMARSEDGIPIQMDFLDANPWLFNCENGTVDLRTGELLPHSQDDLLTKICPTVFNPAAECPNWLDFLNVIMGGDTEMIGFLQRAAGMSLTGIIRDHALMVLYGTGQNGKSTFLNTLQSVIGQNYAMKAPLGMLMARKQENHPTERADLVGQRFITCIEIEEGQRIAESLVKELTGGDRIRARFMRQDFFEFSPTHHIWLAVNHRPEVRGTDTGIWRRIKNIDFSVTIPEELQDKQLGEKLQNESSGILAWAVQGTVEWAQNGLQEPEKVKAATAAYRRQQDVLGTFLEERCIVGDFQLGASQLRVKAGDLYTAYTEWCDKTGEYALKQKRFGEAMTERGFARERSNGIWYVGIAVNNEELS